MKKVWFLIPGFLLLLLSGFLFWQLLYGRYEGKTPEQWFALALRDQANLQEYATAFRGLGPHGSAFLVVRLTPRPTRFLQWYDSFRKEISRFIKLPPSPVPPRSMNEVQCAKKLLGYLEADAAPALIRKLKDTSPETRKRVVQAMGELGPAAQKEVGPHLVRCLEDSSTDVCYESITSLGMVQYRPEDVVPRLVRLLKHPEQRVRLEAAYTLGSYPPRPEITLEALQTALGDDDVTVRANAARALGKLGTNALAAAARLREQLNDTLLPAARAAEALVLIDPAARKSKDDALEQALSAAEASGNDYFRLMALSSRLRRGEDAQDFVPTCLRQLKGFTDAPYIRWEAVERLVEAEVASEEVTKALRAAAADSNGFVRQQAHLVTARKPDKP